MATLPERIERLSARTTPVGRNVLQRFAKHTIFHDLLAALEARYPTDDEIISDVAIVEAVYTLLEAKEEELRRLEPGRDQSRSQAPGNL